METTSKIIADAMSTIPASGLANARLLRMTLIIGRQSIRTHRSALAGCSATQVNQLTSPSPTWNPMNTTDVQRRFSDAMMEPSRQLLTLIRELTRIRLLESLLEPIVRTVAGSVYPSIPIGRLLLALGSSPVDATRRLLSDWHTTLTAAAEMRTSDVAIVGAGIVETKIRNPIIDGVYGV